MNNENDVLFSPRNKKDIKKEKKLYTIKSNIEINEDVNKVNIFSYFRFGILSKILLNY
jgi:hypothetical protein